MSTAHQTGNRPANSRPSGPRRIGRLMPAVAAKALGQGGLQLGALLADWVSIVGTDMAGQATPVRLTFAKGQPQSATLHLAVAGAAALLVQHGEPQLLQRINGFLGYRAVVRLKLEPAAGRTNRRSALPPPAPRRLSAAESAALAGQTAAIADPELRAALDRLGQSIAAAGPARRLPS